MSVGVFTPNISRSKLSTNVSSSVVAELHYHGAPPEICQQDPPVVIVVKTLDYKIRPVFPQGTSRTVLYCSILTLAGIAVYFAG